MPKARTVAQTRTLSIGRHGAQTPFMTRARSEALALAALPYAAVAMILSYAARERWGAHEEPSSAAPPASVAVTSPVEAHPPDDTREDAASHEGPGDAGRR